MNAVEIEEAISELADADFDSSVFPYAFLEAFGHKPTTITRLKNGAMNKSDIVGAVLLANNIHISTCAVGDTSKKFKELQESPANVRQKVKFVLVTDGVDIEAEDLIGGESLSCPFKNLPNHFGFFLPLAGISTVKAIRENAVDIRATSRLNKLYVELLRINPDWGVAESRHNMNHFMARLIFCFFAEDTQIFRDKGMFTKTIEQMSERDSSNTHEVIKKIFEAMNIKSSERLSANLPNWANKFPYVNGGLFAGNIDVPKFSKIARTYLIHAGNLDWQKINPDIFGSMIQAVADDDERGSLGMHYTSVPNILKVLNPLFLDDLRESLELAGNSPQKLLNLKKRLTRIRVFDPACGSGNFLVIAYKEMRKIEAEINKRRGEDGQKSKIPLTNFRGIEVNDFPTEIARLALIIAEYQCDVLYLGQKEALKDFLPLSKQNWITCGDSLQLDWLSICPPTGKSVKIYGDDLFHTPLEQAEIDFENEGGETYICGNPPYLGASSNKKWTLEQKRGRETCFKNKTKKYKSLDYVSCWFMKAAEYATKTTCNIAFVSTNSISQGSHVSTLWPLIFSTGNNIFFAYTSFKWSNLATHNAGVTVVIIGLSCSYNKKKKLYSVEKENTTVRETDNINAYLIPYKNIIVKDANSPQTPNMSEMLIGNKAASKNLILSSETARRFILENELSKKFIKRYCGTEEFISGKMRYCIWIEDSDLVLANSILQIKKRLDAVAVERSESKKEKTQEAAKEPWKFTEIRNPEHNYIFLVPGVSSENREYLPVGLLPKNTVISNSAFALYDAPLWNLAILASKLHLVWIATVCGQLETRLRYSNTLGWNTFPLPLLTEKNKADLTHSAEEILLARERHFPATIADLYDPEKMPEDLRQAHELNDEILERIYIGRRFKNDTERLEKLFEMYLKETEKQNKKSFCGKERQK